MMKYFFSNNLFDSESVAIKHSTTEITYKELNNYLFQCSQKIPYKDLSRTVLIFMEKGIEIVISVLSIYYSKHIFCIMDTKSTDGFIDDVISETYASVIFTDKKNFNRALSFSLKHKIDIVQIFFLGEDLNIEIHKKSNRNKNINFLSNDDISHIIYTSGSTALPKGIICSRKAMIDFIDWEYEYLKLKDGFNVSLLSSVCFEPFIRDVFLPIFKGGCICIPNKREEYDVKAFSDFIKRNDVNIIHIVPTMFRYLFLENKVLEQNIKHIMIAGEMLYCVDVDRYINIYNQLNLYNLYGPSETTMARFCHKITEQDRNGDVVNVGKPLPNTFFELVPMDDASNKSRNEVYIYTKNCSYGYVNSQLNDEKFEFFDDGKVRFKTGDIGRIDNDGNLVVTGRKDNMAKIYGQKVYPEEIEGVLNSIHGIKKSVVIIDKNKVNAVIEISENLVFDEMVIILKKSLISYKIPHYIYPIEALPLNKSGKIDRKKVHEYLNSKTLKKIII